MIWLREIVRKKWTNINVHRIARQNHLFWTLLALKYAKMFHSGMKRKDGRDAFVHPYKVAQILIYYGILDDEVLAAALLHDTLEDVSSAVMDIIRVVFTKRTVDLVKTLTRDKNFPKEVYYREVGRIPSAVLIKLADRLHNLRNQIKNLGRKPWFSRENLNEQTQETIDFVMLLPHTAMSCDECDMETLLLMRHMTDELKISIQIAQDILMEVA